MSLATVTAAIKALIAGADPVSLVHDYERWTNDPAAFQALYVPADQLGDAASVRAWLIKLTGSERQAQTHSDLVELHQFALRFLFSVTDAEASEPAALEIVRQVQQAFHDDPTLTLPGVTIIPDLGPNANQRGPALERNEYLQLGTVLCHFLELRLIVQEDL
jgi:hypothetical protein